MVLLHKVLLDTVLWVQVVVFEVLVDINTVDLMVLAVIRTIAGEVYQMEMEKPDATKNDARIKELNDDMGKVIIYRVLNNGDTYKTNDILAKTMDQLVPL